LPPVPAEYENVREHCAIQLFAILVGSNYRFILNSDIAIQTHVEFVEFGVPLFRLRMSDHPIDMLSLLQEKADRNDMNEIRSTTTHLIFPSKCTTRAPPFVRDAKTSKMLSTTVLCASRPGCQQRAGLEKRSILRSCAGQSALRSVELAIHKCRVEISFAWASLIWVWRHVSTWRCMGSKFRWMRSTANRERIDEVEALGVFGQDRREHARDNVAKLRLSTARTLHVTLSSPARQRCFPSIALGLQMAMVSNSERAPGVALGDQAKQNCTRKLGKHPNCINNLDRSSESLRVRRSN
jgi:hypothetical protein